jgi:membrane dipeptidase
MVLVSIILEHINYVRDLIGPEHVGIGADYNGIRMVPEGLEDTSKYPHLFDKLAEDGHSYKPWSREDLKKLAGLNFIRVFKQVERVRNVLKDTPVFEDLIDYESINKPEIRQCRTDVDIHKSQN